MNTNQVDSSEPARSSFKAHWRGVADRWDRNLIRRRWTNYMVGNGLMIVAICAVLAPNDSRLRSLAMLAFIGLTMVGQAVDARRIHREALAATDGWLPSPNGDEVLSRRQLTLLASGALLTIVLLSLLIRFGNASPWWLLVVICLFALVFVPITTRPDRR